MKKNDKSIPAWAKTGHHRPVTRRDFLSAGLIPFLARALVPGALGLLSAPFSARAENCEDGNPGLAPFITLNLAGGAALMANLLPRDQGFQGLPNYQSLGYPSTPQFTSAYGSESWSSSSGLLSGINSIVNDPSVQSKVQVIQLSVGSIDDTASNSFDVSGMVYAAGLAGGLMPNLGTSSSITGLRQQAAFVVPPRPLVVNSLNDIVNSIGYTAALRSASLSARQKQSVAELVGRLSGSQAQKLSHIRSVAHVKELVECAGIKNASAVGSGSALVNPFAASATSEGQRVAAVWNQGTSLPSNQVFGAMVYNALMGHAGTVNLELGGYDYHDGTRTTGDRKDNEAGQQIGKILQSAAILNRKVAVYLTSDGSTAVGADGVSWVSDRGLLAGSALIFFYDPDARPEINGPPQIGFYNSNGTTQQIGASLLAAPQVAALTVFRNYLAFNGELALSKFDKVLTRGTLTSEQLDSLTKIVPR